METRPRIVCLGAGNVAWSLAPALDKKADVAQVFSPTLKHASELASKLRQCQAVSSLSEIIADADFYIISVKDDAVASVAKSMPKVGGIVAHTSGSVPIEALSAATANAGVFYPLQTFSKAYAVDVSQVPFFIEGTSATVFDRLSALAKLISPHIYATDSAHRASLHLAAVFACNFTNNLWGIAADILAKSGYGLSVFKPLLETTLSKAMRMHPHKAQTGPAVRGDDKVIAKQRSALSGLDLNIYDILTLSISKNKRI